MLHLCRPYVLSAADLAEQPPPRCVCALRSSSSWCVEESRVPRAPLPADLFRVRFEVLEEPDGAGGEVESGLIKFRIQSSAVTHLPVPVDDSSFPPPGLIRSPWIIIPVLPSIHLSVRPALYSLTGV